MTVLDGCVLVMAPVSTELMLILASVTQDLLAWTVKVSISLCRFLTLLYLSVIRRL